MPSKRSLSESRYYAHPQNSFWWIMSNILGFSESISYDEKCHLVNLSVFGIWDVLSDCKRKGSLDSNIERSSEQANDFELLFNKNRNINMLAFNGVAAKQIFMRHCKSLTHQFYDIELVQLPSTSPAYASMNRQCKLQKWASELEFRR